MQSKQKMRLGVFTSLVLAMTLNVLPAQACLSTPEQRRAAFDKLDGDGDGFLTLQEYYSTLEDPEAVSEQKQQEAFAALDTDHDGKISFDEYVALRLKQRCG